MDHRQRQTSCHLEDNHPSFTCYKLHVCYMVDSLLVELLPLNLWSSLLMRDM